MNPSEEAVFAEALEIADPQERAVFLERACAGNEDLRASVESLLAAYDAGSFLEVPVIEAAQKEKQTSTGETKADPPGSDDESLSLQFLERSDKPDSLGALGHYEIREVIGRGGMGIVLRAFDEKLQRMVAIKVMAPELAATSPPRKRFLREARSAAAVRHEHVVDIHAVEERPIPYLVMEYVSGETLQQRLDRVGPLETPEVFRLGQQIARGLTAAHERGLVHRDIKPSNILLEKGNEERVKISDFGLARAADDVSLTQSGVIAGTPMYMAPEQTLGKTIDHRADLFSLGSVLYTMCSGRPPFRATTSMATLRRVAEDTPRPIHEIIPEVPQRLCDIIGKLHAKNPDDRYQSAREVADALADCEAQFKLNAPVHDFSRSPDDSAPVRLRRSRRRLLRMVLLLAAIGLGAVAAAFTYFIMKGNGGASLSNGKSKDLTATPREVRQFVGHGGPIRGVNLSPDAELAVSCSGFPEGDRTIRLWEVATGAEIRRFEGHTDLAESVVFSPDGKHLLSASADKTVRLWDMKTGKEVRQFIGHTETVTSVAFSPDGRRAVSGSHDRMVRLWEIDTGRELGKFVGHTGFVTGVAYSTDGRRVLSSAFDGTIRLWAVEAFQEIRRIAADDKAIWQVVFLDDNRVISGGDDGILKIWDTETGDELRRTTGRHARQATCLSVSADGQRVLSGGGDGMVRLWEVATGREICKFGGYTDVVWAVSISRDGRYALYGGGGGFYDGVWHKGRDWDVRLWRLP
ncbi:MAG TPA: serine/threonine-protein kinase, partial [Gemmataceae bacterium]|nr:serine/threonine-protein kinase [Gemmataceae bacterium]